MPATDFASIGATFLEHPIWLFRAVIGSFLYTAAFGTGMDAKRENYQNRAAITGWRRSHAISNVMLERSGNCAHWDG